MDGHQDEEGVNHLNRGNGLERREQQEDRAVGFGRRGIVKPEL